MTTRTRVRRRAGAASWLSAAFLLPMADCQPARIDPGAEREIGRALGVENAVTFRTEGRPLDEPDAAPDRLTLADAAHRAVLTDPGLQAALARVRIAMAEADQARLLPNPVLDIVLRWGEGFAGKPTIEAAFADEWLLPYELRSRAGKWWAK